MIWSIIALIAVGLLNMLGLYNDFRKKQYEPARDCKDHYTRISRRVFEKVPDEPPKLKAKTKEEKRFFWSRMGLNVSIFIISVFILKIQNNKSQIDSSTASIQSKAENGVTYPNIKVGGMTFKGNGKGAVKYGDNDKDKFDIRIEHGILKAEVYIRNAEGSVIGSLIGSDFKIYDKTGIDFNYDETGYEIITGDQQVIFQMFYNDSKVTCNGLMCSNSGECWYWDQNNMYAVFPQKGNRKFNIPNQSHLPLLFKYPRESHYRERNETYPY